MSDERITQRRRIVSEADALYQAGRAKHAATLLQPCLNLFGDDEKTGEEWGRFCTLYGSASAESGNPQLAIQLFRTAELVCRDNPDAHASLCFNLGNVYSYVDNRQAAYDYYTKALKGFADGKHDRGQATVLLALANFFFKLGANERALEILADFEGLPPAVLKDASIRWSYQMQLANVQIARNEPAAAIEALKQAFAAAEQTRLPQYILQAQSGLGQMRAQLGDTPGALDALRIAYEQARAETSPHYISHAGQYAMALEYVGRNDEALAVYVECLNEIDLIRAQLNLGERFRMMQNNAQIASSTVQLLMKQGNRERAFEISERGQGRATLDLMFEHQMKRQGGRRVRAGRNGCVSLDSPTLSEVQADLARESVHLLKFYIAGDALFAWFLAPNAPLESWDATPALKLLEPVIKATLVDRSRPLWSEVQARLAEFWQALLPEAIREYLSNHSGRLLILPHRQLYFAPFSAIFQATGSALEDKWQIAVAPSAGVFLQLDPRRDAAGTCVIQPGPQTALAVGGVPEQTLRIPLILGQSEPASDMFFPELTFTAPEADRVVELLGGKTLLGSDANLATVRSDLPNYRVLHFATHGYWSPGGGVSLVVLADAPLAFTDVIESPLQAELVVLSACQTGLGEPHPDSYTGITHEFLIGGARSVLMTLWPIKDSATLFFMDKFYFALAQGRSPSEALVDAQRAMRERTDLSDGYDWAAFQLSGRPFAPVHCEKFSGPVFRGNDIAGSADPGQLLSLDALDGRK